MCEKNTAASEAASIGTPEAGPHSLQSRADANVTITISCRALSGLFAAANRDGNNRHSLATVVAANALEHSARMFDVLRFLSGRINYEDGPTEPEFEQLAWICGVQAESAIELVEALENAEGAE